MEPGDEEWNRRAAIAQEQFTAAIAQIERRARQQMWALRILVGIVALVPWLIGVAVIARWLFEVIPKTLRIWP